VTNGLSILETIVTGFGNSRQIGRL